MVADQCALRHCRINSFSFFGIHLKQNQLTDNHTQSSSLGSEIGPSNNRGRFFSEKAYYIWQSPCLHGVGTFQYSDEGLDVDTKEVPRRYFCCDSCV